MFTTTVRLRLTHCIAANIAKLPKFANERSNNFAVIFYRVTRVTRWLDTSV